MAIDPNSTDRAFALDKGFSSTAKLGAEGGMARQQAAKPKPDSPFGQTEAAKQNTREYLDDLEGGARAAGRGIARAGQAVGRAVGRAIDDPVAPPRPPSAEKTLERLDRQGYRIGMTDTAQKNTRAFLDGAGRMLSRKKK